MKALIIFSIICLSLSAQNPPIKVLIITGGHNFEREAFFDMFDSYQNIQWQEIKHPNANIFYERNLAEKFDVLVFYDMNQTISTYEKKNLRELAASGKPMIFLHHSLVSYQEWPEFEKITGGKYHEKDSNIGDSIIPASTYEHDVRVDVKLEAPDHPILQGLSDFTLTDEVYGGFTYSPLIQPLLSTNHPGSSRYIAWINPYENSNIIYIQPGHDHQAFNDANYRKLLHQAIQWTKEIHQKKSN